jgi:PAS domain S-box-containing protein
MEKEEIGYQGILDSLPFYVILVDEDHRIVFANKTVGKVFGVNPGELVGQFCPKAIHGIEEGGFPGCPLEESLQGGGIPVERELYDEKYDKWVLSSIYPAPFKTREGKKLFLHFTSDITPRKKAEEEVARNNDILRVLNSLLLMQLENASVDSILKYTLDQILSIEWLALKASGAIFLVEDDPGNLVLKVEKGLAEPVKKSCANVKFGECLCGSAALSGEIVFDDHVDKDHSIHYEGISDHGHYCVPIISAGKKVLGVITTYVTAGRVKNRKEMEFLGSVANVLAGILERKRIEKEKETLKEHLVRSEKMAALGQMSSSIAHEIRSPLGIILGYAQAINTDISELDKNYHAMKTIESEALRAKSFLEEVLVFSRDGGIKKELVDLNTVIERTLVLVSAQTKLKNVQVIKNFSPDVPPILANENNLKQVILNLCNNALDAMPVGGEITITTTKVGDFAEIIFTDTGKGMTKEVKAHVFEPFFTTKERGKGTGLGLSIVYEIIEKHHGTIKVESEPDEGTTFKIRIPYETDKK